MVKNRRALPSERQPDGTYKLQEERPYKRADGRFYGNQDGGEAASTQVDVRRLIFPFGRLGGRSSPAQALYDDLSDLATRVAR
eukprot:2230917-Prymnesium_polylepis.1